MQGGQAISHLIDFDKVAAYANALDSDITAEVERLHLQLAEQEWKTK